MDLKKLFFSITSIFIISVIFLRSISNVLAVQPVPDFRLKLIMNQSADFTLSFNKIGLEQGPSLSYGINYQNNYYLIRIVDKNNQELFSGKTLRMYQTLPPDFIPVTSFTPEIVIVDPLNLYLPYFNEATKIQMFDENNVLKLEIVLADYNLQGVKYRYAACDLCGYCPPDKTPSTWEKCRMCLYPSANPTPTMGDTLRITDPSSNAGPTPFPEKAYTGIGCINSNQAKLTQKILNLVFSITAGIAFLYLLYGAFIILTSQGDAEKLNLGRRLVYGAIIGLTITLSSLLIVNFIASGILRIPGFGKP
ncbi:hypothetical protein HY612_02380 [Candidatus Roizmanbacteria bacterium]|nr:hypothetical protein [Candidatus Roizmanbacteria bacterium]